MENISNSKNECHDYLLSFKIYGYDAEAWLSSLHCRELYAAVTAFY
jgi:hypothetical protein